MLFLPDGDVRTRVANRLEKGREMPISLHAGAGRLKWLGAAGWVALSLALALLAGSLQESQLKQLLQQRLAAQARLRAILLQQHAERGRQAAIFLANTPPVPGLARASLHRGFDSQQNNSSRQWLDRLDTIFLKYAQSMPDIKRLRLIGLANGGRELARVDSTGGRPRVLSAGELKTDASPAFRRALSLADGAVALSGLKLADDSYWTPCYAPDGKPFAALEVSFDAALLLRQASALETAPETRLFIANQDGQFLSHPDRAKAGGAWRWQDEFVSDAAVPGYPRLRLLTRADGATWYAAAERVNLPSQARPGQWLQIMPAQPTAAISGQIRALEWQAFGLSLLLGALIGALAATYRRQRRDIGAQQAELAAIVGSAQEAVVGHLADGTVTSWNPTAARLFGYQAEEAIGRRLQDLIVPETQWPTVAAWYAQAAEQQIPPPYEARLRSKDGEALDVMISVAHTHTARDGTPRLADTIRDITQQKANEAHIREMDALLKKQMQRELLSTRDQLSIAAEVAQLGIWSWTPGDGALLWNERMCQIYGYPAALREQGLCYEHWRARIHPDDLAEVETRLTAALDGQDSFNPTFRLKLPDGAIRYIQAGARVERDEAGRPLRITGMNRDITSQREYENSINSAREQAESANRAKADFLSNMSHEIRTPMNSILGLAYLLERTELAPDARDIVQKIRASGRSLLAIINDILDFSKIEAGRLQLEHAPFSLNDLLDNLSTIMTANVGDKDIELVITPPPPGVSRLAGDALRLEQVLINLTGNAIKFTERGFVEVSIRPMRVTEDAAELKFMVSDSGIGIPPDKQAQLFQPFTQADATTTRRFGGTGLGLAISRKLVDLMGGKMYLSSEAGAGSAFSFVLTFPRQAAADLSQPELSGLDVFIADDNAIALDALACAASGMGWRTRTASSGAQALAELERGATPDVVILDWKMPDQSGLEVAKNYVDSLVGQSPPVILMATAYSREALLAEPGVELVDDVMTKPVTPSCLYNAVAKTLQRRAGEAAAGQAPAEGSRLGGLRLLVVDDSDINRDVAQRIFGYEGAMVAAAENGQDALDWLRQHPEEVDLVLMDIQMPVMDGYEAARRIRAMPALASLPIVALTAGAFQTQRDAAAAAGMNGYIAKPFDVDQAVAQILRAVGKPDAVVRASAAPRPAPQPAAIEIARGLEVWREASVYKQYLRKFARDYQDIAPSIGRSALPDSRSLAHKLKGVAGNLALGDVEAAAQAVEEQLAAGGCGPQVLNQLVIAMETTLAAIRRYAGEESPAAFAGTPLTRQQLAEACNALLAALNDDDIDQVEAALAPLAAQLGEADTAPLRAAVEDFDFRGAEQAVLSLLHRHFPGREEE